jgi:hypothetical protein
MQRAGLLILLALLLLSLGSATWGQTQKINDPIAAPPRAQRPCQHEVPTFKAPGQQKPSVAIRSITMAPGRESATIEMVNQSTKTITAYAYIADVTYTDGQHCVSEMMMERIGGIAMEEAGRHIPQTPDQELLLPGAVHQEVYRFGAANVNEVADLAITMEVVIYADLTAESTNQWVLDNFISQRAAEAQSDTLAADTIAAAMQDEHPVKSAQGRLAKLDQNDTTLFVLRQNLERASAHGISAEDEKRYLTYERDWHRSIAVTMAKHAKIVGHQ